MQEECLKQKRTPDLVAKPQLDVSKDCLLYRSECPFLYTRSYALQARISRLFNCGFAFQI